MKSKQINITVYFRPNESKNEENHCSSAAHNRLSFETNKLMSSLLDIPVLHSKSTNAKKQQLGTKNSGKRRYSLPKLKEPCPLTPDGRGLNETESGDRRKSFF